MHYKYTQIGYLMIAVTLLVAGLFVWTHIMASQEVVSEDSGSNLLVTGIMTLVICILISFTSLQVSIDETYLRVKFGYGIYRKKFLLSEIVSVKAVKNHWYYGWGVRVWLWPKMWIYNVSGFDAVEIVLKNGKRYRIGTDEPQILKQSLLDLIEW